MRIFFFVFLVLFAGVVGAFIWQNEAVVALNFFQYAISAPVPLIIGTSFLFGMLAGWSVVGMLRRSVSRTAEMFDRRRTYA